MTDFIDTFPDALLLDELGDTITYYKSGAELALKAIMQFDVTFTGDNFEVSERLTTVQFLKSTLNFAPKPDDKIMHKGLKYKLDGLLTGSDNIYETWALVKA